MSAVEVVLATEQPRTLRLERELGDGAEAIVYEAEPDLAVKLFHSPSVEVTRRLESMMALARADDFLNDAAHPELAWPTALVHDADGREVVGYAMRRVGSPDFFPLTLLFSHRHRQDQLGEVSWRFFIGVSRNLTGLMATLHDRGLVLGDISPRNVVVNRDGMLTFLDCDSMQFVAPGSGERFECRMKTPEYTAPELQSDDTVAERTPETDCFSLALLIYRLLLMGDHAYTGIPRDAPPDEDLCIEDKILSGHAYLVRPDEIDVPANAYDPALLPPGVFELSRRTFGVGHAVPSARPTAAEWLAALDAAADELQLCPKERLHVYSGHLPACPWCARAAAGKPDPFVGGRVVVETPRPRVPAAVTALLLAVVLIALLILLL